MGKSVQQYSKKVGNMAINPYCTTDIMEAYPVLQECIHDGISEAMMLDKYFRYCSFVLDPYSPLIRDFPDMKIRRKYASIETGWDGLRDYKVEVLMLKNIYRSREHSMIIASDNMMDEYLDVLNKPLEIQDENELIKTLDLKKKIMAHYCELIDLRKNMINKMCESDKDLEEEIVFIPTSESIAKLAKRK